ncbi:MAG: transcription-repair coupling factor [Clostridiales bacterium]|nr:transcription-repair coupling factor [Clostridiales bacterium]
MSKGLRGGFPELRRLAERQTGICSITGISESRASASAAILLEGRKGPQLILTPSAGRAARLAEDLPFFASQRIYTVPEDEGRFLRFDAKSHQQLEARTAALTAICRGEDCIVIASAAAALKHLPKKEVFTREVVRFAPGDIADLEEVKRKLSAMGYERVPGIVEAKGQFSFRGDILDIFPMAQKEPRRIEFFDDEVDSVRIFDPETQRSLRALDFVEIYPAQLVLLSDEEKQAATAEIAASYDAFAAKVPGDAQNTLQERKQQILECLESGVNLQFLEQYLPRILKETSFLWDYLPAESAVILEDPDRTREVLEFAEGERQEDFKVRLERGQCVPQDYNNMAGSAEFAALYRRGNPLFLLLPFPKQIREADRLEGFLNIQSKQAPVFNGRMDLLEAELKRYAKQGYKITLVCGTYDRKENLNHFLETAGLRGKVETEEGMLSSGMEFPEEKLLILSDRDIFSNIKYNRKKKTGKRSKPIKAFTDIQKGDYVVHENHGIGKFLGVEPLTVQGVRKDYLKIAYAGEDYLYVPVEQMDIVQKYVGADVGAPKVSRLAGGEWKKTKAKAKAAIEEMTKELLELSAARQMEPGYAFAADSPWQRDFEDRFPFEETSDQLRSVKEIKKDMERPVAMERLLCGDVGYGKTEVAARAIFKCINDGKQAAVLVPTTILANQHYNTFKNRLEGFPFNVDVLCRFRSDKEQEATLEKVKRGSVDVLVGTHRMLSKDVMFKNLGLLVIDEEQRFGVQHKEAIKMLRKNIDVLTLSATPIPRTLHMSLVGIRDMSLLEEPPEERYPVQTYVLEQDNELLREAVRRELDRQGQVYVVYNRVKGIQKIAGLIKELVPEAEPVVAHGQMAEGALEDVMQEFIDGKYNVLVATTIIESGLDIPNVNTMIVLDADRFGLSQLYQLRGRVGRSNRMAYAYLMYQKDKTLSEVAEKRLRAIREFTEFGSGFRIAMRDLEIRGAGNLLGSEQHGHMMMIGYELYCKLVEDAVKRLSAGAEEGPAPETPEVSIELDVPAYIPGTYIEDELMRLSAYKKIAEVQTEEDQSEVIDELLDRFGEPPKATLDLISIARIKAMAQKCGITRVHRSATHLVFEFAGRNGLTPDKIADLLELYGMRLLIHGGVMPFLKVSMTKGTGSVEEALQVLSKLTN